MTCETCSGSGVCDACDGYGYLPDSPETDYSGIECVVCDSTTECADCEGTGTTDPEITENDITTTTENDIEHDTEQGAVMGVLEMRQR